MTIHLTPEQERLVQDRFPHHALHGVTHGVITEFEILADFGVRDALQARSAKSGVRKEWPEFEQGVPIAIIATEKTDTAGCC